jgi:hypothetical protein
MNVPPLRKTPLAEGRAQLIERDFEMGPNAGSRGELWIHKSGHPAFITYVGPPYGEYFSTESLEEAFSCVPLK